MHKNKLYCRTYLQHENYTNTMLKSWGWGSGAMVVVLSTPGVGCAGGCHQQRWWCGWQVVDTRGESSRGTSCCRFVATHTVNTVFRCCTVHGSPFTGPCCNSASTCILQHPVHHCNTVRPPLQPLASSCPLLQHFSHASTSSCNILSAIATQPVHSTRFIATLLEPACHMTNPTVCLHPPCNMFDCNT